MPFENFAAPEHHRDTWEGEQKEQAGLGVQALAVTGSAEAGAGAGDLMQMDTQ